MEDEQLPPGPENVSETDTSVARSELATLLAAARVATVIFVDDANAEPHTSVGDVVAALEAETTSTESLAVVPTLRDFFTEDGDLVDNRRAAYLIGQDDLASDVQTALLEVFADDGPGDKMRPDQAAISIVRDLLPEGIRYLTPSLASWSKTIDEAIFSLPPNPEATTLVLIDRDFTNESGRKDQGEMMVASMLAAIRDRSDVFIALVTHQFGPDEELPHQRSIATAQSLDDDAFVVISKLRLTEDRVGFVRRIGDILGWTTVQQLTHLVISTLEASFRSAATQLRAIPLPELRRALVHAVKADSVWEVDQLLRMLHAVVDAELIRQLRSNNDAWQLTERLQLVTPEGDDAILPFPESPVRQLQREEVYLPGEVLALGMALDTGDIFRLVELDNSPATWAAAGTDRYFILLEQNCNMVVRKEGCREPELETLTVAEVVLSDTADHMVKVNEFLLPQFCPSTGADAVVLLNKRQSLPWEALDATVWGPNATAVTPIGMAESPSWLDGPWSKRYRRAIKRADKLAKRLKSTLGKAELSQPARNVFLRGLLGMPWTEVPIELTESELRFGIQRVARLREPYAMLLRAKSGAYQARQALDAPLINAPRSRPVRSEVDSSSEAPMACAAGIETANAGSDEVEQADKHWAEGAS